MTLSARVGSKIRSDLKGGGMTKQTQSVRWAARMNIEKCGALSTGRAESLLLFLLCLLVLSSTSLRAQDFFSTIGDRPTTAPEPADFGFVENATGNLHLEIPLGTVIQRPGGKPMSYRLVYDSAIWFPESGQYWVPGWTLGGWQLVPTAGGMLNFSYFENNCGGYTAGDTNFNWTDYSGVTHYFPVTVEAGGCTISTGDAFATDSSGYHLYIAPYSDRISAPDGTLISFPSGSYPNQIEDSNGNYIYNNGSTDMLGRAVPTAISQNSEQSTLSVPGSQGPINYAVTYATIPVMTAFGQSGVTECTTNCTLTVIQSVTLPDGSQYRFFYDCDQAQSSACNSPSGNAGYYGMLTSVTLPTGGTISYGYVNFSDSYGTDHRWLSSRSFGGGQWTYSPQVISTCSSSQVGCQQSVTVTKPSGDRTVYTFTLNNGAWPTQVVSYDSSGNTLATVNDTWDTSNGCPLQGCVGAAYIRKLSEAATIPVPGGSVTKQTTYAYDSPQTGNVTAIKEWGFYPGISPTFPSVPDRATYLTYLSTGTNDINKPLSVTRCSNSGSDSDCGGSGSKASQTKYVYDSYGSGLTPATGFSNHDDTNFGVGYTARGNPTQIQQWVSGSTYLTTQLSYDTTGQVVQVADPKGNVTQYNYADNFYVDGTVLSRPSPAPPATNAFPTTVTLPTAGSTTLVEQHAYFYGSGKEAVSTDPNNQNAYFHFLDPLDRQTHSIAPIGWTLTSYPSPTRVDTYGAVGDMSPSLNCGSCTHTEDDFDNSGRQTDEIDLMGSTALSTVTSNYDSNSRVLSKSLSGSSYTDTFGYDGLDRTVSTLHSDGQTVQTLFGPAVSGAGGFSSQQGSSGVYGYPTLSIDETGRLKQIWTDGFGRTIEVDEQSISGSVPGSGSATLTGTEQGTGTIPATGLVSITMNNQFCCSSGTITMTVDGYTAHSVWGSSWSTQQVAQRLVNTINTSILQAVVFAQFCYDGSGNPGACLNSRGGSGPGSDYPMSASVTSQGGNGPQFSATPSGPTLTGGAYSTYDAGTAWVTVNGFQATATYGQGSTPGSVASAIANVFNTNGNSPVVATAVGATITLTSKISGASTNYALTSGSSTNLPGSFSQPSFSVSVSGGTLTGGSNSGNSLSPPTVTTYNYDVGDHLMQVSQGAQTRSYTYDGLGRRTSMTTPESGTTGFAFSVSGNLCAGDASAVCQRTDSRGVVTTFSYDNLSRLVGKSYYIPPGSGVAAMSNNICTPIEGTSASQNVCFNYDQGGASAYALGRRTQMVDSTGSETYSYDADGRVTQVQRVLGSTYTIGYQYNAGGEVTQITYPSGRVVQQSFDNAGRLCGVASQTTQCGSYTSPFASGYTYNSAGQTTAFNYGNGVAASYGYSPTRLQLIGLSYVMGNQALFNLNYFYQQDSINCPNGNSADSGQIQCIADNVDSGRSIDYTYDGFGRLQNAVTLGSAAYPAWGLQMAYDRYGNRWSQTVTGGSAPAVSLSFNSTNQPTGYTYDAAGNLTVEPLAPSDYYTYDGENKLVAFQGGGGTATYAYDGNGLRVQETVQGGATTAYIFAGGADIAEYDNGAVPASPSREYIYSNGQLIATLSGGATTYHHSDHLSVRLSTDSNGNKIGEQGHYPFGEAWYTANSTSNRVFTSYERDGVSGLDYAMARYYNPRMAGFCSADPVEGSPEDPQSWNRYTYSRDDPVNITDPSGQFWGIFVLIFEWILSIFKTIGITLAHAFAPLASQGSQIDAAFLFDYGAEPISSTAGVYAAPATEGLMASDIAGGIIAAGAAAQAASGSPLNSDTIKNRLRNEMDKPSCNQLLGGKPAANNLINKMVLKDVSDPSWSPKTALDQEAVRRGYPSATRSGDLWAGTVFHTPLGNPNWNGTAYATYVATPFKDLSPAKQDTVMIHEMAHPAHNGAISEAGVDQQYPADKIAQACNTVAP